jgi:hypothetical protein
MHPTDDLVALGQVRIARAAAAGPRKASQPTSLLDKQHLARLERFERRDAREALVFRSNGAVERIRTLSQADADLAYAIDAAL